MWCISDGEVELRGNIMAGRWRLQVDDAGKTWKQSGLADSQTFAASRHPTNPDVVYAAVFGHPYGKNAERGRLPIQGWRCDVAERCCIATTISGAVDLCMDPHNPDVLYAAIWDANDARRGA